MTRWQRFLCNFLGWHRPRSLKSFDGFSWVSKCVRCGGRILQDSGGGWFRVNYDIQGRIIKNNGPRGGRQTAWPKKSV